MSKSIILSDSQIKAIENNATMIIVPIDTDMENIKTQMDFFKDIEKAKRFIISKYAPIKKGDKDIFIKEEFTVAPFTTDILYKSDGHPNSNLIDWEDASKMTKEQSRYSISECIGGRAVRVQDIINGSEIQDINPFLLNFKMFIHFYNNQLKEHNINRTYEDNDYILLIEVKR